MPAVLQALRIAFPSQIALVVGGLIGSALSGVLAIWLLWGVVRSGRL